MSEPGSQGQPDEAMVDLLVKQVTEGLSPPEQRVLDVMDSALTSLHLREFERAAAAVSLAAPAQPLPPSMRAKLEQQAQTYLASAAEVRPLRPAAFEPPPRARRGAAAGWFAAAACLLLAIFGWFRSPPSVAPGPGVAVNGPSGPGVAVNGPSGPGIAVNGPSGPGVAVHEPAVIPEPPLSMPEKTPSAAEERAALLAKTGALKITLGPTKDPASAGVTGDVVWDPATQKGFIRFAGLAPNDPQVHQYQLWIFDGERDQRYPVDGGVFDVPAISGEVVIPIHAALTIRKPAAFAVTVEKPGGVVVSSREHVVALGAAG
jgi:hypothetical protein